MAGSYPSQFHGALLGAGVAVALLLVDSILFFFTLQPCRAENATHYPATCPPIDHHPSLFYFAGVLGLAAAMPLIGSIVGKSRTLAWAAALPVGLWLLYVILDKAT